MRADMDFDTAVDMLVQASLGPWPDRSASVELIVAVLARKFAMLSEDRIGTAVRHAIAAQGGTIAHCGPSAAWRSVASLPAQRPRSSSPVLLQQCR